ncbi:MAG TPA: hypothetical protein VMT35_10680, partial [Ignavibacteriaceae bacterium]|nr:hypothetical protein [Ignavibacteriaceae bacterium]
MRIADFSIQSLERNDSLKFMFCSEIHLNLGEINFFYPGKKYKLNIKSAKFSTEDSSLILNSFSFHSLLPDTEFFKGDKYRKDRWKVSVPELKCSGINLSNLIWYNAVDIKNIDLKTEYIDILTNKRLPIEPGFDPEMPNEIISKAPIGLNIRKINLNIDSLIIREFWPYSKAPSRLPFTKIKGQLFNLSNMPELQGYNSPAVINASGLLADAGLMRVNLKVPLLSEGTDIKYSGSLTKMDASALNTHLVISDLVKVSSGIIDSISFNAEGKNGIIAADIIPIYRNLKIKTINEESMDSSGLLISMKTFIANVFSIKNENTGKPGEI